MKRRNDFIVGLSVIVISLSLLGATLWANQSDIGKKKERVFARFHDVGNARVGNAVVIRGVTSGRIDAIELADGGWVQVRMALDPTVRLPGDPIVLLNESSLFGEWQATITERSAMPNDDAVRKQILDAGVEPGMMPGATLPDIAKLTAVAGQIAGDVASVAGRVEVAFDDQAARELRASIRNFSLLSSQLATTVRTHAGDLDNLSSGLQSAVVSLNQTAATAQRMAERVDSSASSGEVRLIIGNVSKASSDLKETSAQIRALSGQLALTQNRLDSFLAGSDSVMMKINTGRGSLGLLVNDPSLYHNSDSLLVDLRALVGDLRANPKKYVNVRIF